jgi:predicted SAM-dependent methyltransferase
LRRRLGEAKERHPAFDRVHYGCGPVLLNGWVNLDQRRMSANGAVYVKSDLTGRHPFPDASIRLGYAEDFLEHLDQDESIRFLVEVRRTMKPGGVLRLSFPGLEGVLAKHYSPPVLERARLASFESYYLWGHRHFYSMGELELVARHIGFRGVRFAKFGESECDELRGIDLRAEQADLNTYAELLA